jgi:hypothetical protein
MPTCQLLTTLKARRTNLIANRLENKTPSRALCEFVEKPVKEGFGFATRHPDSDEQKRGGLFSSASFGKPFVEVDLKAT